VPEFTQEIIDRDHEFWKQYSNRLIGDWLTYDTPISNLCAFAEQVYYRKNVPKDFTGDRRFLRDNDGQKAFSKLRSSIAGLYAWRLQEAAKSGRTAEYQRVLKEAEFAFKQAYAYCPYSPEAIFRYINLLLGMGRLDEALMLATTSQKLDPFNGQIENLIFELKKMKASNPGAAGAPPPPNPAAAQSELAQLEQQFKADPKNSALAYRYLATSMQAGRQGKVQEVVDLIAGNPEADAAVLTLAANAYAQLGQIAKVEAMLERILKLNPNNPEGRYDLGAVQLMQHKTNEAMETLRGALQQNAERLAKDPKAPNLYDNVLSDARFASLRASPQFSNLLASMKPK
jgi:tetratricopeptide (TPR) repeat protein